MTRTRESAALRGTRFASREIEDAFRRDRIREDQRTGVIVFTVLAVDVALFALTDRGLPGGPEVARSLFAFRIAITLLLVAGMWLAGRTRSPVAVDVIHLVLSSLFAASMVVVDATRPPDNVIHLVPEVGLIYAGWIFFAGGYPFQAATSLLFTSTSVATVVFFRIPRPPQFWATLVLSIISIHVVGASSSWRLQRSRRLEWLRARELERRSQEKSLFLGTVSHEILAPLGGIVMAADTLSRRARSDDDRAAFEAIRNDSDALHALLSDVLDLARGEAVEPKLAPVPVSPRALLEDVARWLEPRARAKGIALRCGAGAETPGQSILDPARVRQILINLAANAIRVTARGEVSLRCERAAVGARTALLFHVEDTGPGIAPEQQQAIFEPWRQPDASEDVRGGAGLGLAVARRLAERMGGRIDVKSQRGAGSRFTLSLPEGSSVDAPQAPRSQRHVPSAPRRPDPALVEEAHGIAEVPHAGRARALAERAWAIAADQGDAELQRWASLVRDRADALDADGLAAVLRQVPGAERKG